MTFRFSHSLSQNRLNVKPILQRLPEHRLFVKVEKCRVPRAFYILPGLHHRPWEDGNRTGEGERGDRVAHPFRPETATALPWHRQLTLTVSETTAASQLLSPLLLWRSAGLQRRIRPLLCWNTSSPQPPSSRSRTASSSLWWRWTPQSLLRLSSADQRPAREGQPGTGRHAALCYHRQPRLLEWPPSLGRVCAQRYTATTRPGCRPSYGP